MNIRPKFGWGSLLSVSLSQGVLGLKKVEDPCFTQSRTFTTEVHHRGSHTHSLHPTHTHHSGHTHTHQHTHLKENSHDGTDTHTHTYTHTPSCLWDPTFHPSSPSTLNKHPPAVVSIEAKLSFNHK